MIKGFYLVTDPDLSRQGLLSDVKNALKSGVGVIQYRNKTGQFRQQYKEALRLRKLCRKVIFLVNDRLDVAQAVGADGLHIGQRDIPAGLCRAVLGAGKIIGVTVNSLEEAKKAAQEGADYLGVGPIFQTATKKDAKAPVGPVLIRRIKQALNLPVVAIGGINLNNAAGIIKAGADGVCAISAVMGSRDIKKEIASYQKLFKIRREP